MKRSVNPGEHQKAFIITTLFTEKGTISNILYAKQPRNYISRMNMVLVVTFGCSTLAFELVRSATILIRVVQNRRNRLFLLFVSVLGATASVYVYVYVHII